MESGFYRDALEWAEEYAAGLFRQLTVGGLLLAVGLTLLTLGLGAAVFLRNRKKVWLRGKGMPFWPHYGLIPAAILMTVCVCLTGKHLTVLPAVLLGALTALGAYGLARRRSLGVFAALGVLWGGWLCVLAETLLTLRPDVTGLGSYSPVGMLAVYAAGDILVMRAVALEALLCAVTVLLAGYYSRGRFLFLDKYRRELEGLSCCPCGYPALEGQAFCPMCGKAVKAETSALRLKPEDKPVYCVKCGTRLIKDGKCPRCGEDSLKKLLAEKAKEELGGKLKSIVFSLLSVGLLLAPQLFPGVAAGLTQGAAEAKSAFVAAAGAYLSDPSVRVDPDWQREFTESFNALYDVDIRVFDVQLRRLPETDLPFYIRYGESACLRQIVMEQLWQAVEADDPELAGELAPAFDETLNAQKEALTDALREAASLSDNTLGAFLLILVQGVRFYTSFVSLTLLGIILLAAGLAFGVFALLSALRSPLKEGIFLRKALGDAPAPQRKKGDWRTAAAAAAILAVILASPRIGRSLEPKENPGYDETLKAAVLDTGTPVLIALAEEEGDLSGLARAQLEQLVLLTVLEVPEERQAVSESLADLIPTLEEALSGMARTGACSPELRSRYLEAELTALRLTGAVLADSAIQAVQDCF